MQIHKVVLKNIKSFIGTFEFDFSTASSVNTISGINGSGKTTLFKSIILAQRVFFSEQLGNNTFAAELSNSLADFFTSSDSEITIYFNIEGVSGLPNFRVYKYKNVFTGLEYGSECNKDHRNEILKYWNIKEPRKIIVYIDSNRYINESDFTHEGVSFKTTSGTEDLGLDYIFYPDRLFSSIYERIIKDYLRERVIPNTPRKDLPHYVAKILIHELLNGIKINNFTGLWKDNQFILQVKSANRIRSGQYDLRNMSSGEKTIFYILHFICYVKNIGMLIIDEPENNLHENLLTDFVNLLNKICINENFGKFILETAKQNQQKIGDSLKRDIVRFYNNYELSQINLLTHSKNLIYNNFSIGKNYIIDNGFKELHYDDSEKILRSMGLSRIFSKVLFVEGKTDNEFLEQILGPYNIKVKSLGSCHEVIETYLKYLSLKSNIRDVQFCFLIDKDTRTDEEIEIIRNNDPNSFDSHFIVLNKHELENYLLDTDIYIELYKNHFSLFPELTSPSKDKIETEIKALAEKHKDKVTQKRLQNLNQKSFGKLKTSVSKNIPVSSISSYEAFIDKAFSSHELTQTIKEIKSNYAKAITYTDNWSAEWKNLCDGKVVFNEFVSTLSSKFGVRHQRLVREILTIAKSNKFEAGAVIKDIILRFMQH